VKRKVFFISDRTGITVQNLGHSLLTQFPEVEVEQVNLPFVDNPEKMELVLQRVLASSGPNGEMPLVFASLVDGALRAMLGRSGVPVIDFFQAFIPILERELGTPASGFVGRAHGMVDVASYNQRVDAINFTLGHDDGTGLQSLSGADLVLVGVSRSGKTPTALYLALQFGMRTANYPLTEEDFESPNLPKYLRPVRDRLVGLSIQPERLHQIRSERRPNSPYASLQQCYFEVQWAERLFQAHQLPFLHTTVSSIEEIAVSIMNRMGLQRRVF
jgi:regulator of PEP synthase PpsR (kinase-PPPase family)